MHLWKWLYAIFAIAVVVIAVIYSLPPPSNHADLEVNVNSLTIDHADEVLAGQSANTDYILMVGITCSSGSINVNPTYFNINTSIGTYQADLNGLTSVVKTPLTNQTITTGEFISGQIYISLPEGTVLTSVYYHYNGADYKASVPAPNSWVSYIEGINLTLNGQPITTSSGLYIYTDTSGTGDLVTGVPFAVNVYIGNHLNRSVIISNISVNFPYLLNGVYQQLPQLVDAGGGLALRVLINAPSQSFYGYLKLNVLTN